jgi:hypothetical protein
MGLFDDIGTFFDNLVKPPVVCPPVDPFVAVRASLLSTVAISENMLASSPRSRSMIPIAEQWLGSNERVIESKARQLRSAFNANKFSRQFDALHGAANQHRVTSTVRSNTYSLNRSSEFTAP